MKQLCVTDGNLHAVVFSGKNRRCVTWTTQTEDKHRYLFLHSEKMNFLVFKRTVLK